MLSSSHVIANPSAQALFVIFQGIDTYGDWVEEIDLPMDADNVDELIAAPPATIAETSSLVKRGCCPIWLD